MRSGRPVLADCACTNSSAVCVPSPIGSVRIRVELASLADARDQLVDRNCAQDVARPLRLARVALNQSRVRAADAGNRLPGREVHDLVHFETRVGLPQRRTGRCILTSSAKVLTMLRCYAVLVFGQVYSATAECSTETPHIQHRYCTSTFSSISTFSTFSVTRSVHPYGRRAQTRGTA